MKNVYDSVQTFYNTKNISIFPKVFLDGYLRKKAWQGYSDRQLIDVWNLLSCFIDYLVYANIKDIKQVTIDNYIRAVLWMENTQSDFILNETSLDSILKIFQDFSVYLTEKNVPINMNILLNIREKFFDKEKFRIPKLEDNSIFHKNFKEDDLLEDNINYKLNHLIEGLLNKIGMYFKKEEFLNDFNRSISLYTGPFNKIPEEEDAADFWLGFWDYFLFDYHLNSSDETPIKYFYLKQKNLLEHDEIHVLEDLLQTKFTVFYIERIINPFSVECIDLFSGEKIQLPLPDYGMHDYKRAILYGHIHANGVVMLNYITSIPVSKNFRNRIRDEILRQKNVYQIQRPNATIEDFFLRHAILVRHTIDILMNLARVNVIPVQIDENYFFKSRQKYVNDNIINLLNKLSVEYNFSKSANTLLLRLFYDYLCVVDEMPHKSEIIAGIIFYCFAELNGIHLVTLKDIMLKLQFSQSDFQIQYEKLSQTLCLKKFDARYLTEEGFIHFLYEF